MQTIDDILKKVEKQFGKQLSGDWLQQEFYQLAQDKTEKVRQFAGRLEQKYKYLKEKFPDKYQTKDLKERAFSWNASPYLQIHEVPVQKG